MVARLQFGPRGRQQQADTALHLIQLGQMTGALPKWEAALDTFDRIKHKFRAPGQIEKALNSIALDERVLLFRGSDSDIVERLSWYDQVEAVRTLDDVTIISEATARAFHRLKQEEESEREETICCTASSTPFAMAEAAAQRLGFQVKTLDCDLAPNAHVRPLQPVYVWEQNEDSAHEKPKVLARLDEELALSNKQLQATAVFAKPLAVVQRRGVRLSARTDVVIHPATTTFRATQGQLNRYLQIWELKTTKALQAKRTAAEGQALVQFLAINIVTDRPGWGVPVVLSDLTEASVFQRGTGPHDIIHVQFKNLEEAYAHIQWLLDRSKADNPDLRLDTSLAPPAVGMFTIMEHQAHSETDSMSADER
ncbi:hypothetical protein WJX77_005580 [Trebouxia sp. C0004]